MTQATPAGVIRILDLAGVGYEIVDRDGDTTIPHLIVDIQASSRPALSDLLKQLPKEGLHITHINPVSTEVYRVTIRF